MFYHKGHKGHKGSQRAQRRLADWLIGRCGALPHAPAGGSSPCTPGTSATCQLARWNNAEESQASKPLNFQASTCPCPPARLRRAKGRAKATTGDSGDSGDAGAPLRGEGENVVQDASLEYLSGSLREPSWSFVNFVFPKKHSTSVRRSARRPAGAFCGRGRFALRAARSVLWGASAPRQRRFWPAAG